MRGCEYEYEYEMYVCMSCDLVLVGVFVMDGVVVGAGRRLKSEMRWWWDWGLGIGIGKGDRLAEGGIGHWAYTQRYTQLTHLLYIYRKEREDSEREGIFFFRSFLFTL